MVYKTEKKDNINKGQKVADQTQDSLNENEEDLKLSFLRKKTERITAGLYMVTNLLSPAEPLRVRLRECALAVLSDTLSFMNAELSSLRLCADRIAMKIAEIDTLLGVARLSGSISQMNALLLSHEYAIVLKTSRAYADSQTTPLGQVRLPENFFAIDVPPLDMALETRLSEPDSLIAGQASLPADALVNKLVNPIVPPRPLREREGVVVGRQFGKVADKKVDRRDRIIALLKKQSNISIKDAAEAIPECSEKTLQRELLTLIAEGVVVKMGERRWSTYALAGAP